MSCPCQSPNSTVAKIVSYGLPCLLCGEPESVSETDPKLLEIRASAVSDVMPVNECDHIIDGEIPEPEISYWEWLICCPKCGEKL